MAVCTATGKEYLRTAITDCPGSAEAPDPDTLPRNHLPIRARKYSLPVAVQTAIRLRERNIRSEVHSVDAQQLGHFFERDLNLKLLICRYDATCCSLAASL